MVTVLGIRHHGVGSAKHVLTRLEQLKPDLIMIEGAPEIAETLKYIGNKALKPPVSVMVYDANNPKISSFYPFTKFSPEWVAAQFANKNGIPIRTLDMPASVNFNLQLIAQQKREAEIAEMERLAKEDAKNDVVMSSNYSLFLKKNEIIEEGTTIESHDALFHLAKISRFEDTESWWDYYFERLHTGATAVEHFEAVHLGMETLRAHNLEENEENNWRETYMRQQIREAQNEMFQNIVVICGAWHQPRLLDIENYNKEDAKTMKLIPKSKIKVSCSWIPWTNERLARHSGYGAGIISPGWYQHLWESKEDYDVRWLIKVAETFRNKKIDISSAHVIEAVRLAQTLAALRKKSTITLDELNEATLAVMCMGDPILLNYIKHDLIVQPLMGAVPDDLPKLPIHEDFDTQVKALRLPIVVHEKQVELDLRKENDLKKSILLHRLVILEVKWGTKTGSRTKGTFKETWNLNWQPEVVVQLIDKAYLGNTIEIASTALINDRSKFTTSISELALLITDIIPAELFGSLDSLLEKINELSTISTDIVDLMKAISPLVNIGRYGNVRKTDASIITIVVENLFIKINIGLSNACYGLDETQSEMMFLLISKVNEAVKLFEHKTIEEDWYRNLELLHKNTNIHPVILGCVSRLLLDANLFSDEEAEIMMTFSLSTAHPPQDVAFWLQGFLKGSGSIILYDERLWNLLYVWVASLELEIFMEQLPFLRRSFSKFEFAERREIGQKAKQGLSIPEIATTDTNLNFDNSKAEKIIPILSMLMGIKN